MANQKQFELQDTSDRAAFYALLCMIPIFIGFVTYGWGKILQPILPISAPFDSILAYLAAIFLAVAGVVLAKVIAADGIRLAAEPGVRFQFAKWMARSWAYLLVLLVISALGTTRTIFQISEVSVVLSNELSETGKQLSSLHVAIEAALKTPEYDTRVADYKAKRIKVDSLVAQFETEMQLVREVESAKLNKERADIERLWRQFAAEMNNPQNCGFGLETAKRFDELNAALKEKKGGSLTKLSGEGTQCSTVPAALQKYKDSYEPIRDSIFTLSNYKCGVSATAAKRLDEIQAVFPDLKPLESTTIPCDKLPEVVKTYSLIAKTLSQNFVVSAAETPIEVIEFKKKSAKEIQLQVTAINNVVFNSIKVTTNEAIPILRKSWEVYKSNLSGAENLADGKRINLPRDIKKEEVLEIENLTNILRILVSRWNSFMTYLILFAAVLMDMILIAFFRRHLSSGVRKIDPSPYGEYATGDNIFKN